MSSEILPTIGRVAVAQKVQASGFLAALSRGNPSWDGQWNSPNPPSPGLEATDVLLPFGFVKPTIVDFLTPDDTGQITGDSGQRYSVSATPTRYVRVRVSIPAGSFAGETIREIGLFIDPTFQGTIAPGQTVIPAANIADKGRLFSLIWMELFPLEDGTQFTRNFIVRL